MRVYAITVEKKGKVILNITRREFGAVLLCELRAEAAGTRCGWSHLPTQGSHEEHSWGLQPTWFCGKVFLKRQNARKQRGLGERNNKHKKWSCAHHGHTWRMGWRCSRHKCSASPAVHGEDLTGAVVACGGQCTRAGGFFLKKWLPWRIHAGAGITEGPQLVKDPCCTMFIPKKGPAPYWNRITAWGRRDELLWTGCNAHSPSTLHPSGRMRWQRVRNERVKISLGKV